MLVEKGMKKMKMEFEVGEVREREVLQVQVLKAYSSKLGCQF